MDAKQDEKKPVEKPETKKGLVGRLMDKIDQMLEKKAKTPTCCGGSKGGKSSSCC